MGTRLRRRRKTRLEKIAGVKKMSKTLINELNEMTIKREGDDDRSNDCNTKGA